MAPTKVTCTNCGKHLTLKDRAKLGKKLKCPHCGEVFVATVSKKPKNTGSAKGAAGDTEDWDGSDGALDDWQEDDVLHRLPPRTGSSQRKKAKSKNRVAANDDTHLRRLLLLAGVPGVLVIVFAIWVTVTLTRPRDKAQPEPPSDGIVQEASTTSTANGPSATAESGPGEEPPSKDSPDSELPLIDELLAKHAETAQFIQTVRQSKGEDVAQQIRDAIAEQAKASLDNSGISRIVVGRLEFPTKAIPTDVTPNRGLIEDGYFVDRTEDATLTFTSSGLRDLRLQLDDYSNATIFRSEAKKGIVLVAVQNCRFEKEGGHASVVSAHDSAAKLAKKKQTAVQPAASLVRTWSTADGEFSERAILIAADDEKVKLRCTVLSEVELDLEDLSEDDRAYVESERASLGNAAHETIVLRLLKQPLAPKSDNMNLPDLRTSIESNLMVPVWVINDVLRDSQEMRFSYEPSGGPFIATLTPLFLQNNLTWRLLDGVLVINTVSNSRREKVTRLYQVGDEDWEAPLQPLKEFLPREMSASGGGAIAGSFGGEFRKKGLSLKILTRHPQLHTEFMLRCPNKSTLISANDNLFQRGRFWEKLDEDTHFEFSETPLPEVLAYLKSMHGTEFKIDEAAMDNENVSVDGIAVTRSGAHLRLKNALTLLLSECGLTWSITGTTALVTTMTAAEGRLRVTTYSVRDLAANGWQPDLVARFITSKQKRNPDLFGPGTEISCDRRKQQLKVKATFQAQNVIGQLLADLTLVVTGKESPAKRGLTR